MEFIDRIEKLYTIIQQVSDELEKTHLPRMQCRKGCFSCCVDDIDVFGIEAENIRSKYPEVLKQSPNAPGMCAFLDKEGACRIYDARPFVCRTHGLPLRSIMEENNKWFEIRDICPLNENGPALENMDEKLLFFTNPFEEALAQLQLEKDSGKMERVNLREMFF